MTLFLVLISVGHFILQNTVSCSVAKAKKVVFIKSEKWRRVDLDREGQGDRTTKWLTNGSTRGPFRLFLVYKGKAIANTEGEEGGSLICRFNLFWLTIILFGVVCTWVQAGKYSGAYGGQRSTLGNRFSSSTVGSGDQT